MAKYDVRFALYTETKHFEDCPEVTPVYHMYGDAPLTYPRRKLPDDQLYRPPTRWRYWVVSMTYKYVMAFGEWFHEIGWLRDSKIRSTSATVFD